VGKSKTHPEHVEALADAVEVGDGFTDGHGESINSRLDDSNRKGRVCP
jgi:hypothetical protein